MKEIETRSLFIRGLPKPLKEKLQIEAIKKGISLNRLIVGILQERRA